MHSTVLSRSIRTLVLFFFVAGCGVAGFAAGRSAHDFFHPRKYALPARKVNVHGVLQNQRPQDKPTHEELKGASESEARFESRLNWVLCGAGIGIVSGLLVAAKWFFPADRPTKS